MLLEELGYVVETASIFGRTTAVALASQLICACTTGDVHAMVNCYAPTVIQTYDTPSSGTPSGLALQFTPVGLWNR